MTAQSFASTARPYVPSAADAGGDLAAKIYKLLDQGMQPLDIVGELRAHRDVVDGFADRWVRGRKAIVLTRGAVVAIAQAVGVLA